MVLAVFSKLRNFVKHGEDHLCQIPRLLDNICDRRCILNVFDTNQDGGKSIMSQNDLTWPNDSNDILFVNIG